ncbi:reverse transcriptase domain-containing protein [Tanacetum coccineum]
MVWKVSLNKLAMRLNLAARMVTLASTNCPFCDFDTEDIEHVLIKCHRSFFVAKAWEAFRPRGNQGCYTEIFQVKYATCTLLDGALTWCNSYVKLVGLDVAYETTWKRLKQMLADEYCPMNEVQKMETELWNMSVNGTDIVGYTKHDIQGNVTSSKLTRIQEAIRMAHDLMDQVIPSKKLKRAAGDSIMHDSRDVPSLSLLELRRPIFCSCLMSCEIRLQIATWLKTIEEFTRGWVRLGCVDVDTQMTWMQRGYREIRNTLVHTRGRATAIAQPWEDFKKLPMEEYCPDDEVQKLESEFWNHKMVGSDINGYTARFYELTR